MYYRLMHLRPEAPVLIFVGEGDFSEQDALAARKRAQGWHVGKNPKDAEVQEGLRNVKGRDVVVIGATAGDCVASTVISALWGGAQRVFVPLVEVMGSYGGDRDGVLGKARILARRLKNAGLVHDTRLTVTPTKAWNQALTDFEDFFGE